MLYLVFFTVSHKYRHAFPASLLMNDERSVDTYSRNCPPRHPALASVETARTAGEVLLRLVE